MAHLCWRVWTGRHEEIEYSMQIPGHTRCLVDSGFAHIRKLFRRSDVDSLDQFNTLINKSASTNEAVPFQTGSWTWREWKKYLSCYFSAVKGIRQFHHFRFMAENPWTVYVKERVDTKEKPISMRKRGAPLFDAPDIPEQIISLVFHVKDNCICIGVCVRMSDQLTRKLCVLLHQRSRLICE